MHDFKIAIRQLLKTPASTLVAVVTIALGIGASTAVFSLVNSVLLRSLPVPNPHELQILKWEGTDHQVMANPGVNVQLGNNRLRVESFSSSLFHSLRDQLGDAADIFGFAPIDDIAARIKSAAFNSKGMAVSDNFFSGLKVGPHMGQLYAPGDAENGSVQNVVITHAWWERYFGSDANVLGETVALNGRPHTIIGVLPRDFAGVRPNDPRDFYLLISPGAPFNEYPLESQDDWWIRLMARVNPEVTVAQFGAQLQVAFGPEGGRWMQDPEILVESGQGGLAYDRNAYDKPLWTMLGIVGMVMLVVCANLSGLALARGAARHHEHAIRSALGAMRWRLMRFALAENMILALTGGGIGILIAVWGRSVLSRLLAGSTEGLYYDFGLDITVLGFCLGLAMLTALLSGLIPAWRAACVDPVGGLKERGSLGVQKHRTARLLVIGQICLSLLLLFGAGLYARTFINLIHVDKGFESESLLVFDFNPRTAGYRGADRFHYYDRVQTELAGLPGVDGATFTDWPLLSEQRNNGLVMLSGIDQEMHVYRLTVWENFFETIGVSIMQGRGFLPTDSDSAEGVVVVNEAFVRKYTPNESPIGQIMDVYGGDWRVVGVCRDIKNMNLKEGMSPAAYFSRRQHRFFAGASAYIHTKVPPSTLATTVRQTMASVDPDVPIARLSTQDQISGSTIGKERFLVTLGGSLAGVALLLSCIGLYGLMACHVTGRHHEIAIRMAVGAERGDVARPIVREALVLAAIGIAIGLPLLRLASRVLKSQLYGVQPYDLMTIGAVIITLMIVALLAAWVPAWRATKVDPVNALRCQ